MLKLSIIKIHNSNFSQYNDLIESTFNFNVGYCRKQNVEQLRVSNLSTALSAFGTMTRSFDSRYR